MLGEKKSSRIRVLSGASFRLESSLLVYNLSASIEASSQGSGWEGKVQTRTGYKETCQDGARKSKSKNSWTVLEQLGTRLEDNCLRQPAVTHKHFATVKTFLIKKC